MSRDWQKDMELAHTARYEYKIEHLNPVLDALFYWLQEAEKWRREAFRKYPTPEAYDAACEALHKHRERADMTEKEMTKLRELIHFQNNLDNTKVWNLEDELKKEQERADKVEELYAKSLIKILKMEERELSMLRMIKASLKEIHEGRNPHNALEVVNKLLTDEFLSLYPKEGERVIITGSGEAGA